jgi:hypothetical protein
MFNDEETEKELATTTAATEPSEESPQPTKE